MIAVAIIGIGLAVTRRPSPFGEFYEGGLWLGRGAVFWSDGSVATYRSEIRDSLGFGSYEEPRRYSIPDPYPMISGTYLGGLVTSLEWSDGSRGWYFTPFRTVP